MIKAVIKLALVLLLANAGWRVGGAYILHYKFTDSVQQTTLFRGKRTDDVLRQRVFELASDYDIPVGDDDISLRSEDHHTIVEGSYTRELELIPGVKFNWPFSFRTDTLSGIL